MGKENDSKEKENLSIMYKVSPRPTQRKARWISGKPYTSRDVRTVWRKAHENLT
ncbi:hypothetical protein EMIT019CA3_210030 [Bacillus pseudomycoides]